ncbi:MAG TPA: Spy/CpxP family protein refolding chaperone [Candidatus Binatia bacterium]|jgi:Spy/CpxP family protein refolding chaperone
MNDTTIPALPPASHTPADDEAPPCTIRQKRRGFAAGVVLGILGAGLIGFAIGATMPAAEAAFGALAGPRSGGDGPVSAEDARDRADFVVSFALRHLDASTGQQEKVQKIVDGAVSDLFPVVERHRAAREELRSVLSAASIDRTAIENIRTQEISLADNMSKIVASAIADSADVLTPAQRSELLERLDRFRRRS